MASFATTYTLSFHDGDSVSVTLDLLVINSIHLHKIAPGFVVEFGHQSWCGVGVGARISGLLAGKPCYLYINPSSTSSILWHSSLHPLNFIFINSVDLNKSSSMH